MHVEDCCQSILSKVLPLVDHERRGLAVDIGVGTFAFYCELFDKLGFQTVAVEPLPTKQLLKLCCRRNIRLIQTCISETQGDVAIFIGQFEGKENLNLSSLRHDWWGSSAQKVIVPSINLDDLVKDLNYPKITCIKIDVEGVEFSIIHQLSDLKKDLLPKILMFEYGGGNSKKSGIGGWEKEIFNDTINAITLLKRLAYKQILIIDSAETRIRISNLEDDSFSAKNLFKENDIYGNIIVLKEDSTAINYVNSIRDNYDERFQFLIAELGEPISKKIPTSLRRIKCNLFHSHK